MRKLPHLHIGVTKVVVLAIVTSFSLSAVSTSYAAGRHHSTGATAWGVASYSASAEVSAKRDRFINFTARRGTVACFGSKQFMRCDVADPSWAAPPRPADCDWSWGNSVLVRSRTSFLCYSKPIDTVGPALHRGAHLRTGDMRCVSLRAGLRCHNDETEQGFVVSRSDYRFF